MLLRLRPRQVGGHAILVAQHEGNREHRAGQQPQQQRPPRHAAEVDPHRAGEVGGVAAETGTLGRRFLRGQRLLPTASEMRACPPLHRLTPRAGILVIVVDPFAVPVALNPAP